MKNVEEKRPFLKRQTSGTSGESEWQRIVQQVTTNDKEWQEWQRVVQRMTTSENFD